MVDLPDDLPSPARALLVRLHGINTDSERIQAEAADAIGNLNAARGRVVAELRDVHGIGVARQAELTGVHYTTLYRSLPKKPRAPKAAAS